MSDKSFKKQYWMGIDVGGTKILAEIYDQNYKLMGSKKRKTKAELGQNATLERLIKTGHEALKDAGISLDQLSGVGIGCPGALNLKTGSVVKTDNLGWKNVELKSLLKDAFGSPVAVANDVDAGTFGEFICGAGKGAWSVLGVFPGTGIGAGLVYEGKIFRGKKFSCMEIGHLQVIPDGPLCGCGMRGCLEAVAGRLAISSAASMAVIRGQAPWLRENAGSDIANVRSSALAGAVENGDGVIERIIRDSCVSLGQILGGLVNILAPDVIVLGGGLVEAMPKLYLETVQASMDPKIMDALQGSCKLRIANLGDHATALGAAALVREQEIK